MRRYIYLLCLLLSLCFVARAGVSVKQVKAKAIVHNDTTAISPRAFNKDALQHYREQKEFQYDGKGYVGESLWTRFWRWFWSLFDDGEKRTASGIFVFIIKYLFIGLGLAALVFLILKLAGIDAFNALRRKSVSGALPYDETVENIYAIDLDAEIEKAVGKQNYRLAVRLLYLRLLKQLSEAGLIHWEIDKTNNTYANELANPEQRIAFKMLTRQFEYVWYGEFMIDAQVYKKISALFGDIKIKQA